MQTILSSSKAFSKQIAFTMLHFSSLSLVSCFLYYKQLVWTKYQML